MLSAGFCILSPGLEKNKTDRQYFRAAAIPADEIYYLPDNQHNFYKESSYPR
jgi:hypothetical protein